MTAPHIEIKHPSEVYFQDVAHIFPISGSVLDMPKHIAIGQKGDYLFSKIESYAQQVLEYTHWLKDNLDNEIIQQALEKIYEQAQGAGVIITTICNPSPFYTHAHVVKELIMELAGEVSEQDS